MQPIRHSWTSEIPFAVRIAHIPFLLLCCGPLIQGAELASWSARNPLHGDAITLTRGPGSDWRPMSSTPTAAVELTPLRDYFKRASFSFRLDRPVQGPAWLSIGFLDRGYGVVSPALGPAGKAVPQKDSHGAAILNTGKLRFAVFRLADGLDTRLVLTGVRLLHSVTISDTQPPLVPLPAVKPAFTLRRPMDLVITAGADAPTVDGLPDALAYLRNQLPLMKALGFNGIESYVKWNFVERTPGVFDWSYYDAIVAEVEKHGMKWFPLLIVGSAYALPDWFYSSPDNHPFVCLEHGQAIEIPTIFGGAQEKYVRRFLTEFGAHYAASPSLLGIRLGPSGNYGEAQYPATGAWGYKGRPLHTHIGYWAGDPHAIADFRRWLAARYASIESLNKAWAAGFKSFDEVRTFLPVTASSPRMRLDFSTWYIDAMSEWCDKWAVWARQAMPRTSIYQSSGGWGALEIGTDYAAHARSMARLGGGIRMTNENDSYLNNFGNTRLAASAARFYGAKWGTEPAGFSSMRGVVGRIYNALVNDAEHLFYYEGNLTSNDQAIGAWLKYAPLLDARAKPQAPIAVFFNDTANKLRDDTLRYLRASAYLQRVHSLRAIADFDLVSEQMIADGALSRYKALVMIWGNTTEQTVLDRIDDWVRQGGAVFYPDRELSREGPFQSTQGDSAAFRQWQSGDTGKGRAFLYSGQTEPFSAYAAYVRRELSTLASLPAVLRSAVAIRKPDDTFWTVLDDGRLAILNYGDDAAAITLPGGRPLSLAPYSIWVAPAPTPPARPAAAAKPPLKISVYATAGGIQRLLATPESRTRAAAAMRGLGASRIILEGRRGDEYVAPETLRALSAQLSSLGIETSGGIATVPGKAFGVRQQGALGWLNWEAPATQKGIADFFNSNAAVFDELVVDDFYCTMDTSPASDAARAGRDWGQYRRDLLTGLVQPIITGPARQSNPNIRMVIKYPQWYDRFHLFGYDPARMSASFDRVWVGTEVRNPKTQRMGFVQPTQGYMNYRWLSSLLGEKVEAAWFDHIECTAQNFVDQAWQSVLAGARELVLFNLIDVVDGHPGHALFQKALPEMQTAARRIQGQPLQGVAFYKPPDSDPGDNRFLMDYLGMLGIPVVPVSAYPLQSRAVILGLQAAHDPQLLEKVRAHLKTGARIAMTASLLERVQAPAGIIRLDLRTFSEQDYTDVGEWLLPPKELPWLDMPRDQLDALRKSLGVDLSAPARIAYYRFASGDALYSFLDHDASITLNGKPLNVPAHTLRWVGQ